MARSSPDVDAIVVGDSSALHGIEPQVIFNLTGINILNLATAGEIGRDAVLQAYLTSHRKKPIVVLYEAARAPYNEAQVKSSFDNAYIIVHFNLLLESLREFVTTSGLAPTMAYEFLADLLWRNIEHRDGALEMMKNAGGFVPYNAINTTAIPLGDCHLNSTATGMSVAPLTDVRDQYRATGIPFFLYIAPIPACDVSYSFFQELYRSKSDNDVVTLPSRNFADYAHPIGEGPQNVSVLLAAFLKKTVNSAQNN